MFGLQFKGALHKASISIFEPVALHVISIYYNYIISLKNQTALKYSKSCILRFQTQLYHRYFENVREPHDSRA